MGRHTVGNKRGSVRGAPPDVYVGFLSVDGEDPAEQMKPAFIFFKTVLFIIPGLIIMGWFAWAIVLALFGKNILID